MAEVINHQDLTQIDPDTLVIFDHIPKCAGTSFCNWLSEACGGRMIGLHMYGDYLRLMANERTPYKAIAEHTAWGVHACLPPTERAVYITMLRDPLKTAISHYGFYKTKAMIDADIDINSFLLAYKPNLFTNTLGRGDLAKATDKLLRTYCAFGLVERYDESLEYISGVLGLTSPSNGQAKFNVSPKTPHKVADWVREYFLQQNEDDYTLFALAQQEFARRIAAMPRSTAPQAPAPQAEKTVYTDAVPELEAALDKNDHALALALIEQRDVNTLPMHILRAACTLAQKLGDLTRAKPLFAALHTRFPHTYLDMCIDFYISIGEHEQAMALAQAELRLFDGIKDIPRDSVLFDFYMGVLCSNIKASFHVDTQRMRELIHRAAGYIGTYERALTLLAQTLCSIRLYQEVVDLHACSASTNTRHEAVPELREVASACYHLGQYDKAQALCRQVLAIHHCDLKSLIMLLVIDRMTKQHQLDLEDLTAKALSLRGSTFSSALLREIAIHRYESGNTEAAFQALEAAEHPRDEALLESCASGSGSVTFAEADLTDLVVIKSGPNLVLDYLYAHLLSPARRPFDVIGLRRDASPIPLDLVHTCATFPGPRYCHTADHARIREQLGDKTYRNCVVVMSNLDFPAYGDILRLAHGLAQDNVYLYCMVQISSPKFRERLLRHC